MKITQRSLHTNPGVHVKSNKVKKGSRGNKKPDEKSLRDPNSSDSQEKITPIESLERDNGQRKLITENVADVKSDIKKNQLEKRKQDGSEWKSIKKTDCQRLETVLEEGQLSSEEAPSKRGSPEESNLSESDTDSDVSTEVTAGGKISAKGRPHELVAISEQPELSKNEIDNEEKRPQNSEKGDAAEDEKGKEATQGPVDAESEEKSVAAKRNINLNGMMEILPIFSNDKFVCSRDAISIEEYEEMEPLEKRRSLTGDGLKREGPLSQFEDRLVETAVVSDGGCGSKDPNERKLRYKLLTDRTLIQKTSSHFINSLLALTPFAAERDKFLKERKQSPLSDQNESNFRTVKENLELSNCQINQRSVSPEGNTCWPSRLKCISLAVCTTLGLLFISFGFAWKSYEPPCMIDYLLQFIPFIRRRRTYTQLFFDELMKILSSLLNVSCNQSLTFVCIPAFPAKMSLFFLQIPFYLLTGSNERTIAVIS